MSSLVPVTTVTIVATVHAASTMMDCQKKFTNCSKEMYCQWVNVNNDCQVNGLHRHSNVPTAEGFIFPLVDLKHRREAI